MHGGCVGNFVSVANRQAIIRVDGQVKVSFAANRIFVASLKWLWGCGVNICSGKHSAQSASGHCWVSMYLYLLPVRAGFPHFKATSVQRQRNCFLFLTMRVLVCLFCHFHFWFHLFALIDVSTGRGDPGFRPWLLYSAAICLDWRGSALID